MYDDKNMIPAQAKLQLASAAGSHLTSWRVSATNNTTNKQTLMCWSYSD